MFGYLSGKMLDLFSSIGRAKKVSDLEVSKTLDLVKDVLTGADVPFKIVKKLCEDVALELKDVSAKSSVSLADRVKSILFHKLEALLGGDPNKTEEAANQSLQLNFKNKNIILIAGLQGSGKTTTIAKLATYLKKELGFNKILSTSLDFIRPAAVDQLRILAGRVGVSFLEPVAGDVNATLDLAKKEFLSQGGDFLIIDTPGRLHVDSALMLELQRIVVQLNPMYKLLVIDSMIGQESLNVARAFNDVLDITGAVLSKADSDSKGGVALALYSEIKKPVLFLGVGEGVDDFEKFIPKRIASRMLGSGDIQTLVERIDKALTAEDKSNNEKIQQRFFAGQFTFEDFLSQMEIMNSFGSLQKLASYIPGLGKISNEQLGNAEKEIKRLRAIIHSMTPKERLNPSLLNKSRLHRISLGAGVSSQNVTQLLNKFEECKRFAKLMKDGNLKNLF